MLVYQRVSHGSHDTWFDTLWPQQNTARIIEGSLTSRFLVSPLWKPHPIPIGASLYPIVSPSPPSTVPPVNWHRYEIWVCLKIWYVSTIQWIFLIVSMNSPSHGHIGRFSPVHQQQQPSRTYARPGICQIRCPFCETETSRVRLGKKRWIWSYR